MSPLKNVIRVLVMFLGAAAGAQRLPFGITPQHYALTFAPDLEKAVFNGDETIDLEVNKATRTIVLNAIELEFQETTVTQEGRTQSAKWSFAPETQQATLTVPEDLQPGAASLHIKMRGFYLVKTKLRNYAASQFESTDARRAVPSFDEPAYKAKFDVALVVNKGDTAISNGHIISDTPGPGEGKHTIQFSTTPKMPP